MGITTLDLNARIAAKKAVTRVTGLKHKLSDKVNAKVSTIKDQRAALKAELNTIAPAQ